MKEEPLEENDNLSGSYMSDTRVKQLIEPKPEELIEKNKLLEYFKKISIETSNVGHKLSTKSIEEAILFFDIKITSLEKEIGILEENYQEKGMVTIPYHYEIIP